MAIAMSAQAAAQVWELTECRDDGQQPRVLCLRDVPITVGRVSAAMQCITSSSISKAHAEIRLSEDGPVVDDLGSTNGTYVNGVRVQHTLLKDGDLLQFANSVFRVGLSRTEEHGATMEEGAFPWAQALLQFDNLMNANGLIPHYQPIVDMQTVKSVGYEMLARSSLDGLQNPGVMFSTAAKLDQECALSELLRREGVLTAQRMQSPGNLFLNTHPKETGTERLYDSLVAIRTLVPKLQITLEIHEAAVTDSASMRVLRKQLNELDMKLAYDDFGAGQARLDELADVPPDFLKFDIKLVREIDKASSGRIDLFASLV